MTVEAEREKRVEAIERRLNGQSTTAEAGEPQAAAPVSIKGSSKKGKGSGKFPGVGKSLSGHGDNIDAPESGDDDGDDEENDGEFGGDAVPYDEDDDDEDEFGGEAGSDFEEEYQSGEDEEDYDEEEEDAVYGSDDEDAPRGGSGTYNLRTPNSKRKLGAGDNGDEDGNGPSLRTRQRRNTSYSEGDEEAAEEDEDEDEDEEDDEEDDEE
ncbi:hypothetical protein GGI12_000136 [Dipsacomyces acuminosporus]|nr:hypothetical protein GGI12_000136 [Dipsacomyces acuminosporus]